MKGLIARLLVHKPQTREKQSNNPARSILYKSTAGRYRPVSYPEGPITARCRFGEGVASSKHFLYIYKGPLSAPQGSCRFGEGEASQ